MSKIQIPSSALMALQPATATYEEHFVIRFPPGLAASVRSDLQETGLPGDLEISFTPSDKRIAKVKFDGRTFTGVLCDLPTILETHKTTDRSQYVKVADVHQVLLVLDGSAEQVRLRVEELRQQEFRLDDGLTPPMKSVRTKRFSTKAAENVKRMEEIERRVRELIEADERALSSNCTLYDSQNRPINLEQRGSKKKGKKDAADASDTMSLIGEGLEPMDAMGDDMMAFEADTQADEQESDDSDFAARLEDDLLEDLSMETEQLPEELYVDRDPEDTLPDEPAYPPELLNLQQQIKDKRALLGTMTNPAIRERIEDAIKYLEDQLATKLAALDK